MLNYEVYLLLYSTFDIQHSDCNKKVGSCLPTLVILNKNVICDYSSSSKLIASRVVCSNSYSSLLPTIMFSKSRKPVPAGIG
jgi:hypothetical protein